MKRIYPDYNNSIMSVSNSFLKYYKIQSEYNSLPELDNILQSTKPDHIFYVLLDGMGLNVVMNHLEETDALRKHLVKGISSVFPSTTVAATNAVLSARPPISTGYIGWVQYFKNEDVNLVVFQNHDFYDADRTFEEVLRFKYLPYDNIVTKIQKKGTNSSIFFPSFAENGSESFKEEIEKALLFAHHNDTSFSYIYWVEPDLTQHKEGINSPKITSLAKSLSSDFEGLIDNVPANSAVIVIADHGLTDVSTIPFYNNDKLNNMLQVKPSIEPRCTNFFVKKEFLNEFKEVFIKDYGSHFELLTKTEFLQSNLLGKGTKHKMVDTFLGDYIAIAKDNSMFSLYEGKNYKAHHAGLSEDEMQVPLIIFTK